MEGFSITKTDNGYKVVDTTVLTKAQVKNIIKSRKKSIETHESIIKDLEQGIKGAEIGVKKVFDNLKIQYDIKLKELIDIKNKVEQGDEKLIIEIVQTYLDELNKGLTLIGKRLTTYDKDAELKNSVDALTAKLNAHLEEQKRYQEDVDRFKAALKDGGENDSE